MRSSSSWLSWKMKTIWFKFQFMKWKRVSVVIISAFAPPIAPFKRSFVAQTVTVSSPCFYCENVLNFAHFTQSGLSWHTPELLWACTLALAHRGELTIRGPVATRVKQLHLVNEESSCFSAKAKRTHAALTVCWWLTRVKLKVLY